MFNTEELMFAELKKQHKGDGIPLIFAKTVEELSDMLSGHFDQVIRIGSCFHVIDVDEASD